MSLSNLFLLVNLGCEMLYIVDQRLTAQEIGKDKAAQGKLKIFSHPFTVLRAFCFSSSRSYISFVIASIYPLC